ncbi:hypothetical protein PVAND_013916 [Polypedilum vanderplanki]|uniref:Nose resistant-to-fluoxetine protein N-terminal domain-containing protein n=1 Tax=Polypedilum vanderplanki TaxID=319348 RepID=A0A9J6CSR0_POLVA|nr:hypothetical protein PVAND_013916 [Polypedilum vanderplanki]
MNNFKILLMIFEIIFCMNTDGIVSLPGHLQFKNFNHILNFSSYEISSECKNAMKRLKTLAEKFDFTALKILDASAKIGSGLLNGNVNHYGDYDLCIDAKSDQLQGKYCLADIQFHFHDSLNQYRNLLMAHEPYKNKFDDVPHITPKSSNIFWAVCMPSACSHHDLELAIKSAIDKNFGKYIKSIELAVKEENCQVAKDESVMNNLSLGTKLTIGIFGLILLASCLSTLYDSSTSGNENRNELFLAFSIRRNFNEIISTEVNNKEIGTLNGIRFINTILILLCHKCMEIHYHPIANKTALTDLFQAFFSVPLRACYLSTEVFLMMSGLLTTYILIGKLNRGQNVGVFREIIARYFRFTPPVIAIILFCAYIFPIIGRGPIWPILIESQAKICRANGWRNILMIQNWFNFEDMCMYNLHHIGTDFMLFLVSIILIIKLHKYPRFNILVFAFIAIASNTARFYIVYTHELNTYVRYGASIENLKATCNEMYAIPLYRFPCYIFGILMGYILRNHTLMTLTPRTLKLGWILSTYGLIITAFISYINNFHSEPLLTALFASVAPLTFCMFFSWIILLSHNGFKNFLTNFFEIKYFKITTSLSYGIYLVQFLIFNYNAAVARVPITFSFYHNMFDLNEFVLIITAALLITLFVELPFENLRKKIFDTKSTSHNYKLNVSKMK